MAIPENKVRSMEDMKAHIRQMEQEFVTKNGVAVDGDAAAKAAMVPQFSKGTAAIDEKTAMPIGMEQPEIGGRTTLEVTGEQLENTKQAVASRDEKADPHAASSASSVDAPEATTPEPKLTKGEQSAEAAAAQIVDDLWSDTEDITYEDSDLGEKFVVRAPKKYAKNVQNGYARRAIMDRNSRYLSEAKADLEPLITSGQMRQLLPLIKRATQDQKYAEYVIEGYNRLLAGKELTPAQAQAVAAVATPDAATSEPIDPWLQATLSPLQREMQETQRLVREMADRENARIRDMEQAALAQRQGQELAANTHRELHNIYPDSFSGDFERDKPFLNTIANYAHSAGYFEQYGINSGAMRLAFLELMRGRQEMASPAAAALNAAANIEARPRPAAAVAPGSTTTSTPVKRAPVKPLTKDANGRFLSAKEYAEQVIRGLVPN